MFNLSPLNRGVFNMVNSKLIELIKTLEASELKRFIEFVSSPYYNKDKEITKLADYIVKFFPDFSDKKIEKNAAYSELFPRRKYNDKIMRNLMSGLLRLGERFFETEHFEKDLIKKANFLLTELMDRRLNKHYERIYSSAMQSLEKEFRNDDHFINAFYIGVTHRNYQLRNNVKLETINTTDELIDPLTAFFAIYFTKIVCNIYIHLENYKLPIKLEHEFKLIENLFEYVEAKNLKSKPMMQMYYYLLKMYKEGNDMYLEKFRNLISVNKSYLNRTDLYTFYLSMQSYCLIQMSRGVVDYNKKIFEINKEMLSSGAYSFDESTGMHHLVFKNIMKHGVIAKQYQWTVDFIEEYIQKLKNEFRDNLYNFSYAFLYFRKNDFEMASEYLAKVNYANVYDKLDVRCLLIQIYYEINAYEELSSQIDSFKHFLANDTLIAPERKEPFVKFINFVNILSKLKIGLKTADEFVLIGKEIKKENVYDKTWLLEKAAEIKK